MRNLERAGVPRSAAMKLTGHKTELIYRRYAIVSEADLGEATAKLSRFHAASQAEQDRSPDERSAKMDTKRAQSELREQFEADIARDDDATASTGTHGRAVDSGASDFAAALPATHPVDQAHWKLYPPSLPSTSRISPTK